MMTMAEETALCDAACAYLRAQGAPVTPEKVESYVRARSAEAGVLLPGASIAQITTAVHALNARMHTAHTEEQPMNARTSQREFAKPTPHFAKQDAAPRAPESQGPTAPDELAALKTEAAQLKALIANPATGAIDRTRASQRLTVVKQRIEQLETGLTSQPRAGDAPTAGDARLWATPSPHFKLSDAERAEHAARATTLRAKIATARLRPDERISLAQELRHVEHLLAITNQTRGV